MNTMNKPFTMIGSEVFYNGGIGCKFAHRLHQVAMENIELEDVRLIDIFNLLKQSKEMQAFYYDYDFQNLFQYMDYIDLKAAQDSFELAQKDINRNAYSHLEIQRRMCIYGNTNELFFENQFDLKAVSKPLVMKTPTCGVGEIAKNSVFGEHFERVAFLKVKFNPKIITCNLDEKSEKKYEFFRDELNLMEIFKVVTSEIFSFVQGSPHVDLEHQKIKYDINDFSY